MRGLAGIVVGLGAVTSVAQGALFTGGAVFTTAPNSQLGAVTNNLVITNTALGFVVTGTVLINVPAAPTGGILVQWLVERPLDPTYTGPFNLTTITSLDGFSLPPPGGFQNTAGQVTSRFTAHPGSDSSIAMQLVNGIDTPAWNPTITVTSPVFTYTPGAGLTLQQYFVLDGIYTGGPGGTWTIDVPVTTSVGVPEPSAAVLVAGGAVTLAAWRRRRGRRLPPA